MTARELQEYRQAVSTDYDNLRLEAETYRQAWRRAERRVEELSKEVERLRRLVGRADEVYLPDIGQLAVPAVTTYAVSKWMQRYKHSADPFPAPKPGTHPYIWDKVTVIDWLKRNKRR